MYTLLHTPTLELVRFNTEPSADTSQLIPSTHLKNIQTTEQPNQRMKEPDNSERPLRNLLPTRVEKKCPENNWP